MMKIIKFENFENRIELNFFSREVLEITLSLLEKHSPKEWHRECEISEKFLEELKNQEVLTDEEGIKFIKRNFEECLIAATYFINIFEDYSDISSPEEIIRSIFAKVYDVIFENVEMVEALSKEEFKTILKNVEEIILLKEVKEKEIVFIKENEMLEKAMIALKALVEKARANDHLEGALIKEFEKENPREAFEVYRRNFETFIDLVIEDVDGPSEFLDIETLYPKTMILFIEKFGLDKVGIKVNYDNYTEGFYSGIEIFTSKNFKKILEQMKRELEIKKVKKIELKELIMMRKAELIDIAKKNGLSLKMKSNKGELVQEIYYFYKN